MPTGVNKLIWFEEKTSSPLNTLRKQHVYDFETARRSTGQYHFNLRETVGR